MKILVIQPYADGVGHYGHHTALVCQQLVALGHQVVVCANVNNADQYLKEVRQFTVVTPDSPYPFFEADQKRMASKFVWLLRRIRNNLAVLKRAVDLAKREQFDVVQLFGYELVSTWLFLTLRRPLVFPPIVAEFGAPNFSSEKYYGGPDEHIWRRLQKLAIKRMLGSWIRAVCVTYASHVPELRKQLDLQADFVIELVSDTREIPQTTLDKYEARKKIGLSDYRGCVFLFFGTIRKDKGIDNLVKAFGKLQSEECRLVIAGMPLEWNMSDEIKRILSDPRVITRFEFIPDDQVDTFFYASDALVLPHDKFYAAGSGPFLEARARGLPVIVSDVADIGRITRENDLGMIVPPDEPAALAEAMKCFIGLSQEQKARWAANGLRMARENDRSAIAKRYVSVYEKAISTRLTALPSKERDA